MEDLYEEWDERKLHILKRFVVTASEYEVMAAVSDFFRMSAEDLVGMILQIDEGDNRNNFSHHEYLRAIADCIDKNWLEVLTPEMCQRENKRLQTLTVPELFDDVLQFGDIEFTPKGYFLFRQIIGEIFGQQHVDHNDCGWNLNKENCEFEILAGTETICQKIVSEIVTVSGLEMYVGQSAEIVSISEITRLDAWKPNPFIVLSPGFQCKIRYKVLPK